MKTQIKNSIDPSVKCHANKIYTFLLNNATLLVAISSLLLTFIVGYQIPHRQEINKFFANNLLVALDFKSELSKLDFKKPNLELAKDIHHLAYSEGTFIRFNTKNFSLSNNFFQDVFDSSAKQKLNQKFVNCYDERNVEMFSEEKIRVVLNTSRSNSEARSKLFEIFIATLPLNDTVEEVGCYTAAIIPHYH